MANSPAPPELRPLAAASDRTEVSLDAAPRVADVVAGMRAFGAQLHRATAPVDANWTASPLSIATAFGMLRAGARGSTAAELDAVFGFPDSGSDLHFALNALTADIVTNEPHDTARAPAASEGFGPDPVVAIANGLFVDTALADEVEPAFLRTLATHYGAVPTAVSFADPAAAAAINAWVVRETRERITQLFDQLDPDTLLVLANAVYLKAAWQSQFREAATTETMFRTAGGNEVTASMMRQRYHAVRYAMGDGWQRITLPYVGADLAMRIVLPTAHAADLAGLAPALAAATEPSPGDRHAWVELSLPRWRTETGVPLVAALRRLGLTDAFTTAADFGAMAPRMCVSDAVHRATITVDERGTEAAAVTGTAITRAAMVSGEPIVMRADRPFAWAVVHEPSGAPVFLGHVVDPAAQ